MKPPPLFTKAMIADFCAALNGSSPVVIANISTSVDERRSGVTSPTLSVAVTTNAPVSAAIDDSAWRAGAMDSCRKPVVAVSIRTRIGVPTTGEGEVGDWGAPLPDEAGVDDEQPAARTRTKENLAIRS